MKLRFAEDVAELFKSLCGAEQHYLTETSSALRIDGGTVSSNDFITKLKRLNAEATKEGVGSFDIYGEVAQEVDIEEVRFEDLLGDQVTVVFEKKTENGLHFFLTLKGFEWWLRNESFDTVGESGKKCIRVLGEDNPFSTYSLAVQKFETSDVVADALYTPEQPWKLVRDLTRELTPQNISPWLLETAPIKEGPAFAVWKEVAKEKLVFCLPSEIRHENELSQVVFRGGRSIPIAVDSAIDWSVVSYDIVHQACSWIYANSRESETRFHLLNNHIATSWVGESGWPSSLNSILPNSLAGAKEAFAFHLQDQSKEAVKSLGELRKGLQEEVNKTQLATRDLISSIWRDFAVAGLILALKAPVSPVVVMESAMKVLYFGVSILLSISLVVGTISVWRFNYLADVSRKDWRNKLYNFMSDEDWRKMVERPILSGRFVYWVSWLICFVLYSFFIRYFLSLVIPDFIVDHIDSPLLWVLNSLKKAWCVFGDS